MKTLTDELLLPFQWGWPCHPNSLPAERSHHQNIQTSVQPVRKQDCSTGESGRSFGVQAYPLLSNWNNVWPLLKLIEYFVQVRLRFQDLIKLFLSASQKSTPPDSQAGSRPETAPDWSRDLWEALLLTTNGRLRKGGSISSEAGSLLWPLCKRFTWIKPRRSPAEGAQEPRHQFSPGT